eukprot:1915050-Amphidinium_carterae.1
MQHWRGFPGRAAQMLSAEPEHAVAGLSYFKQVAELWEVAVASSRTNTTLRSICIASPLNTPCGRDLLAEVRESSSTCVSASLRLKLRTLFSFGQSKIQEDTFRLQRQTMERSGSSKQSLSTVRKWMIPVAHEVASKQYNYEEVSYKSTASTAPNINGRCLPKKFFHPLETAGSMPFKSIMSKEKGKASWPSY